MLLSLPGAPGWNSTWVLAITLDLSLTVSSNSQKGDARDAITVKPRKPSASPPESEKVFVSKDGRSLGPFSLNELMSHISSGLLLPTDLWSTKSRREWKPISTLLSINVQNTKVSGYRTPKPKAPILIVLVCFTLLLGAIGYVTLFRKTPDPFAGLKPLNSPIGNNGAQHSLAEKQSPTRLPVQVPPLRKVTKKGEYFLLKPHEVELPDGKQIIPQGTRVITLQEGTVMRVTDGANEFIIARSLLSSDPKIGERLRQTPTPKITYTKDDAKWNADTIDNSALVGIKIWVNKVWVGNVAERRFVSAVQLFFLTDAGVQSGRIHGDLSREAHLIVAKDGYSLGGLVSKKSERVDALKLQFMKLTATGLDASQSYESEWVGGDGDSDEKRIGGSGASIIGLNVLEKVELYDLDIITGQIDKQILSSVQSQRLAMEAAAKTRAGVPAVTSPIRGEKMAAPILSGLSLDKTWDSKLNDGSQTRRDLQVLFAGIANAEVNFEPKQFNIYKNVTYLMPFEEAAKALGLSTTYNTFSKLACPGMPYNSFTYAEWDVTTEGTFNHLLMVLDRKRQVVSIQLWSKNGDHEPKPLLKEWHTYNFMNTRCKADPVLLIAHEIDSRLRGGEVVVVNSRLYDPRKKKTLEYVQWHVPRRIVGLILHRLENAEKPAK